jgi:hypothetical protein
MLQLEAERRIRDCHDAVGGIGYVGTVPVLDVVDRPLKNWRAVAKWMEDKLLGSLLLIFVGPLMALTAILIKLDSPGPVLFVQKRFGFNNEVIGVFKFRTMHIDRADPSGAQRTVRNDPRVTRLGRILRWLSFEELPQLINVIRGDMSLVGPRPHAVAMKAGDRLYGGAVELSASSSRQARHHRLGPGQWVARRGRYARKGARPGRARSLLRRALVPLARSEDPPEDGGKFLPRVTTHTDICMIHFPAEMSRYRFAPECPEL